MNSSYGGFYGGDPRKFHPDEEVCTPEEIANHKEACAKWDRGELVEVEGHVMVRDLEGKPLLHINKNPFGLGITVFDDEPEEDEEEPELEDMDDAELLAIYEANEGARSWEAHRILAERNGTDTPDDDDESNEDDPMVVRKYAMHDDECDCIVCHARWLRERNS